MSDWDKITTAAPVNSQAAKQMGAGVSFNPSVNLIDHYPDCPPIKPHKPNGSATDVDYTGQTFGRLRVLGRLDNARGGSWVCRCQCGGYCTRKTKSLRIAERTHFRVCVAGVIIPIACDLAGHQGRADIMDRVKAKRMQSISRVRLDESVHGSSLRINQKNPSQ